MVSNLEKDNRHPFHPFSLIFFFTSIYKSLLSSTLCTQSILFWSFTVNHQLEPCQATIDTGGTGSNLRPELAPIQPVHLSAPLWLCYLLAGVRAHGCHLHSTSALQLADGQEKRRKSVEGSEGSTQQQPWGLVRLFLIDRGTVSFFGGWVDPLVLLDFERVPFRSEVKMCGDWLRIIKETELAKMGWNKTKAETIRIN